MSTTVTFAGNLVEDPELHHTVAGAAFLTCRLLVNDRTRRKTGQWFEGEPTPHNVTVFGTTAPNMYDSAGRGDRIVVHGPLRTEAWQDRDSGRKRTRQVVEVSDRFGEVGASFLFTAARIERRPPDTGPDAALETPTDTGQEYPPRPKQKSAAEPASIS